MRTRNQITEEFDDVVTGSDVIFLKKLFLEVLIDIRDELAKSNEGLLKLNSK